MPDIVVTPAVQSLTVTPTVQSLTVDALPSLTIPASDITYLVANLSSNVTMTGANQYYSGSSVTLTAGTWLVIGEIDMYAGTAATFTGRLADPLTPTTYASGESATRAAGSVHISVSAIFSVASSTMVYIQGQSNQANSTIRASTQVLSESGCTGIRAILLTT